jgi:mono/diheme cytochrome c family protein
MRFKVLACLIISWLLLAACSPSAAQVPADGSPLDNARSGFVDTVQDGSRTIKLTVVPANVGENLFTIDLSGDVGESQESTATLTLSMPAHDMELEPVELEAVDGSRFTIRNDFLTMEGDWLAEITLGDTTHTFEIPVTDTQEDPGPANPVPASAESIAAGASLFADNCAPCHGAEGRGDGPLGRSLSPQPSDLSLHTAPGLHTDGRLYLWITDGFPGSAMPAYRELLSDEQRWRLVNFIRTLAVDSGSTE